MILAEIPLLSALLRVQKVISGRKVTRPDEIPQNLMNPIIVDYHIAWMSQNTKTTISLGGV